jgi:hypothetical protein
MQCPNCGRESAGKYCPSCGADLAVAVVGTPTGGSADPNATSVISRVELERRSTATSPAETALVGAAEAGGSIPGHRYPFPPLTTGQIFNDSFHLYWRNLPLLAGTSAALAVAQLVLTVLLHVSPAPAAIGGLLSVIVYPALMGVLAVPVTARYLDQSISVARVFSLLGRATLGTILLASLIFGLAVTVGMIVLIVPGIYLLVRFLFTTQIAALERADLRTAFVRSAALVRGSWWRVFGLFILVNLPAIPGVIVVGIIRAILNATAGPSVADAWILIAPAFLIPLITVSALTMLYYDLRVRKEGFAMPAKLDEVTGGVAC